MVTLFEASGAVSFQYVCTTYGPQQTFRMDMDGVNLPFQEPPCNFFFGQGHTTHLLW